MDESYAQQFEKFPGNKGEVSAEQMRKAEMWESAMSGNSGAGVPEFRGNKFGIANEENNYYGEKVSNENEEEKNFEGGINDAAALINYGLDAAARELGVEAVVQKIKTFNASGSENPIRDLYVYLGIDTPKEVDDMNDEAMATISDRNSFKQEAGVTKQNNSAEGAMKAINDMKELIMEVEGADPRYAELRDAARAAGKGYFEYAAGSQYNRGLTDLFQVLAAQREAGSDNAGVAGEKDDLETNESGASSEDLRDEAGGNEEKTELQKELESRGLNQNAEVGSREELEKRERERLNPEIIS